MSPKDPEIFSAAASPPPVPEDAAVKAKALLDAKVEPAEKEWKDRFWAKLKSLIP